MTRTGLPFHKERGLKKQERAREARPPSREETWTPEEGRMRVLEGLQRGTARTGLGLDRIFVRVRVRKL